MKSEPKRTVAASVEAYLHGLPEEVRNTLQKVRQAIKEAAPNAEEVISYQIPTYKYYGALVHFAAFKNHCSFFGISKSLLKTFKDELQPYKVSGTTIQFTVANPLSSALIKKMVAARVKENEGRHTEKQNKKAALKKSS